MSADPSLSATGASSTDKYIAGLGAAQPNSDGMSSHSECNSAVAARRCMGKPADDHGRLAHNSTAPDLLHRRGQAAPARRALQRKRRNWTERSHCSRRREHRKGIEALEAQLHGQAKGRKHCEQQALGTADQPP